MADQEAKSPKREEDDKETEEDDNMEMYDCEEYEDGNERLGTDPTLVMQLATGHFDNHLSPNVNHLDSLPREWSKIYTPRNGVVTSYGPSPSFTQRSGLAQGDSLSPLLSEWLQSPLQMI
ncbi:hypothetical protein IWW48_000091 [Coemansia sp. RSA 1200]|nr:hypothetical protein IWW48_000091 [Coemansia sp. RSA 1200]